MPQGQQSDREYAAVLARSKWRQSRWAPARIRMVSPPVRAEKLVLAITLGLHRHHRRADLYAGASLYG